MLEYKKRVGLLSIGLVMTMAGTGCGHKAESVAAVVDDSASTASSSVNASPTDVDGDAEDRSASLFSYSQGGWETFVGWESDEQVRDWVTTAVFVRLLNLRADPDGPSSFNTQSMLADFEVLDVVGGQHQPVRSPDLESPRAITVIIDVEAQDPHVARADLEANIGSDYLLFLTEATDRPEPETGRSPYYRVWPDPLVTYALADDGTYQPAVWSYRLLQDAERRGAEQIGETWAPQPLPPLMASGDGGPIDAVTGRTRLAIMSEFASGIGKPSTPIPDGMYLTEPSPYPVIEKS